MVEHYEHRLGILILGNVLPALAGDVHVHGYTKRDGTYVQPHFRSAPDGDRWNNWSTKGNVNPYTGQWGTKSPHQPESFGGFGGNKSNLGGYGDSSNPFAPSRRR